MLGWYELRSLAAEGVTLAAHSRVHPLLERIEPEDLDDEIAGSMDDLRRARRRLAGGVRLSERQPLGPVVARVRALGIRAAFTTVRGVNDLRRADWQRLRRINVGGRSSSALIRAQALGWLAR